MVHIVFEDEDKPTAHHNNKKSFVNRGHEKPNRIQSYNSRPSLSTHQGGFKKTHIKFDVKGEAIIEQGNKKTKKPYVKDQKKIYSRKEGNKKTKKTYAKGQKKNISRKKKSPTSKKHGEPCKGKTNGKAEFSVKEHQETEEKKCKKVWIPFEKNEEMTRYEGIWVLQSKVEYLDRLKASLNEQKLDEESMKRKMMKGKQYAHKRLMQHIKRKKKKIEEATKFTSLASNTSDSQSLCTQKQTNAAGECNNVGGTGEVATTKCAEDKGKNEEEKAKLKIAKKRKAKKAEKKKEKMEKKIQEKAKIEGSTDKNRTEILVSSAVNCSPTKKRNKTGNSTNQSKKLRDSEEKGPATSITSISSEFKENIGSEGQGKGRKKKIPKNFTVDSVTNAANSIEDPSDNSVLKTPIKIKKQVSGQVETTGTAKKVKSKKRVSGEIETTDTEGCTAKKIKSKKRVLEQIETTDTEGCPAKKIKSKKRVVEQIETTKTEGCPAKKKRKHDDQVSLESENKVSKKENSISSKKNKTLSRKQIKSSKASDVRDETNTKEMLQFEFVENTLMTKFDGVWVKRTAVPQIECARKEVMKQIYLARKDAEAGEELNAKEQNVYHKLMKKKLHKEYRNLRRELTNQRKNKTENGAER